MGGIIENPDEPSIEFLLSSRTRTDSFVPSVWISVPIANYTLWALVASVYATFSTNDLSILGVPLSVLAMAGFLVSAATSYLVYVLVNRRNIHLAREQALLAKAIDSAKSRTRQDDLKTLLPLSSAEHNFVQLSQVSGEKSAVLWALLTFVPYAGWLALIYVLSFLSQDLKKHELKEELVIQDLDRSFRVAGNEGLPGRDRRSPYRNIVSYVALSLVLLGLTIPGLFRALAAFEFAGTNTLLPIGPTNLPIFAVGLVGLGVFLNFWLHEAIQDPQEHFDYHQRIEPGLFQQESSRTPKAGSFV